MRYVIAKCGNGAVVIFYSYAGPPTTISEEQKRRATTRKSADINVAEGNTASVSEADFLGNSYNKHGLMQAVSINAKQAIGDADTIIVGSALQCGHRN